MALIHVSISCPDCSMILAGLVNTQGMGRDQAVDAFKQQARQNHAKVCKGKAKKAA